MEIADATLGSLDLSVTDLRLYGSDHVTPDALAVQRTSRRLASGESAILALGLTRPYPPEGPIHWLQVNNVHFEADPLWREFAP